MDATSDKPLIDTAWLGSRLGDSNLRIYDCTVHLRPATPGPYVVESGRADYDRGHIPGAAFLDLDADLSDQSSNLRFTLPAAETLAAAFGRAGIAADDTVVLYSSTTPMWATRVWWMLRGAGHPRVLVLDGGFAKWRAEGRVVSTETKSYPATRFECRNRTDVWADKQQVLAAIDDGAMCTINALSHAMHTGASEVNYGRKGHITGSVNVPYASLLRDDGTFHDAAALTTAFTAVGALTSTRAICYCGGGISATMDALALVVAGHPNVAVYDGSMSEWVRDTTLPMSLGDGR